MVSKRFLKILLAQMFPSVLVYSMLQMLIQKHNTGKLW